QQARDGLERGALARAVAAQQRHDLPAWHGQRQPAQGLHDLVVDDLDVVDVEDQVRGLLGHVSDPWRWALPTACETGATQARAAVQGPPRSTGGVPLPTRSVRAGGSGAAAQG